MPEQEGVPADLPDVGLLFAETWRLFKDRFSFLLLVGGAGAALTLVSAAAPFLVAAPLAFFGGGYAPWILATLVSLSAVLWFAGWAQVALMEAVLHPEDGAGVLELYRRAWGRVAGFSWVCLLAFIFSVGGFFLFLLPGFFLGVGFLFVPFVFLAEDLSGMDALARSLEHVRGRWLAVSGRLLLAGLASALPSYIPLIGPFTGAVTGPFSLAFLAVLYRSLKNLGPRREIAPMKTKLLIAAAGLGFLFPVWGTVRMIPVMREALPGLKAQFQYLLEHPGDSQAAQKILALLQGDVTRENVTAGLDLLQVSTTTSASGGGP